MQGAVGVRARSSLRLAGRVPSPGPTLPHGPAPGTASHVPVAPAGWVLPGLCSGMSTGSATFPAVTKAGRARGPELPFPPMPCCQVPARLGAGPAPVWLVLGTEGERGLFPKGRDPPRTPRGLPLACVWGRGPRHRGVRAPERGLCGRCWEPRTGWPAEQGPRRHQRGWGGSRAGKGFPRRKGRGCTRSRSGQQAPRPARSRSAPGAPGRRPAETWSWV